MSLAATIARLKTGTYTVTRRTSTGYGADGRRDAPTTATFSAEMAVQPVTGRDLQQLPEGVRSAEARAVWCATELKTREGSYEADAISIGGATWIVVNVESWENGSYWRALVQRTGDG